MGYNLKKSMMEQYEIHFQDESRCQWAVISIDNNGFFNAQTDCGDFNYRWTSFGDCFKSFLIRIDMDYLYDKISKNVDHVDIEKTVWSLKSSLLYERKRLNISEGDARYSWDELEELVELDGCSADTVYYAINGKTWFVDAVPFWHEELDFEYKPDYGAKTFCEIVMPIFTKILREEVKKIAR